MDGPQQPENPYGQNDQPVPPQPVTPAVIQAELLQPRSVASPPTGADGSITWTASEFIAHQKTAGWYGVLALITALLAVVVWFIVHDAISAGMVVIVGLVFGIYAARQPRDVRYTLDHDGLRIEQKFYPYQQFRSFAIMHEGAFSSIVFTPLKRFTTWTIAYYDPRDEQKIVDMLNNQLPLEHREQAFIDQLMWRIRF